MRFSFSLYEEANFVDNKANKNYNKKLYVLHFLNIYLHKVNKVKKFN